MTISIYYFLLDYGGTGLLLFPLFCHQRGRVPVGCIKLWIME